MKLAFYVPSLNTGGAEYVILEIITYFSLQTNWEILLFTDKNSSLLISEVPLNVKIYDLELHNCINIFSKIKKLHLALKQAKVNIAMSHISNSNIHLLLLKYLNLLGDVKVICVEHSVPSLSLNKSKFFKDKVISKILSFFYNKSDAIICVSMACKLDLIKNYKIDSNICHLVYNPINSHKIIELSQEPIDQYIVDVCKNKKIISTISRLAPEKNVEFLIKSFAFVKEYFPELEFMFFIIGDGQIKENLQKLVNDKKLNNNVLFLGNQKNPFKYLSISDLFVFAGKKESFGNVFVEALVLNKKIITLESPGAKEILENGKYGKIIEENELKFGQEIYNSLMEENKLNEFLANRALIFDKKISLEKYKYTINKLLSLTN